MVMTSSVKRAKSVASVVTGERADAAPRKRVAFHLLKVRELDRVTDDAVAITFEVPESLKEEFTYEPGQHVAVRATIAGDDVRLDSLELVKGPRADRDTPIWFARLRRD
jgi:ring-1,2-phenylacetyl-CoA epoxidase subunit PaaE